jgi:hypothetical protein
MDNAEPYDEIQRLTEIERITKGKPSHLDMDAAFCARMHTAIAAGLEKALIGVITTPAAVVDHSPSSRRRYSFRISSAMLVRERLVLAGFVEALND